MRSDSDGKVGGKGEGEGARETLGQEDSDAFRGDCFEKQRKFLSESFTPVGLTVMALQFVWWLVGIFNTKMAFLSICAIGSMVLSLFDYSFIVTRRAREIKLMLGFWIGSGLLHGAACFWSPPSLAVRLLLQGHYGLALKGLIGVLHFPDVHFWLLNLFDTAFWLMGCHFGCAWRVPPGELMGFWGLVIAFAIAHVAICAQFRKLCTLTLWEAAVDVLRRRNAEQLKARFLSYIMHEMRNPLSGASLLIFEFQAVVKEVMKITRNMNHPDMLRASVHASMEHLQQLTGFVVPQFEKMRGVCDDVLQLEKLEKGGLEYTFRPLNIRAWVSRLAGQGAPLFGSRARGSGERGVQFSFDVCVEGEGAKRQFEKRPRGVADFVRLDQVVSNFLSNARKFTKEGTVKLLCSIREPSEEEEKQTPQRYQSDGIMGSGLAGGVDTQSQQWAAFMAPEQESESARKEVEQDSDRKKKTPTQSNRNGKSHAGFMPVQWVVVRVSVTDSGPGLSGEDMSKLFKPYGQVRAGELQNGGGTGLGLVICKSFVEAHAGGKIGVSSEGRGKGSTFFFELFVPLLESSEEESEAAKQTSDSCSISSTPTECQSPSFHTGLHGKSERCQQESSDSNRRRRLSFPSVLIGSGREGRTNFSAPSRNFLKSIVLPAVGAGEGKATKEKKILQTSTEIGRDSASQSASAQTPKSPLHANPSSTRVDVLLVDDDRFCLMAGSAVIKRLGFSVHTAEDGDEAVRMIVEERREFRLVLMDKNMARMDGTEALRKIRQHFTKGVCERSVSVPLLVGCIGDAVREAEEAFLQAGAERVIMKPLQAKDLSALLA